MLPEFDGTPDTWFTINGIVGPEFVSTDYQRPNSNQAAPFWYHDHAFGVTRLDVGFGLSGFAILRDHPFGAALAGSLDLLPATVFTPAPCRARSRLAGRASGWYTAARTSTTR